MSRKKGFSLVELIVVMAIIGIVTAVLVPTWSYFIMKANLKTQNNYSKVIFNAAQTQATRLESRERPDYAAVIDGDAEPSVLYLASDMDKNTGHFEYTLYWDGSSAHRLKADGSDDNSNQTMTNEFAEAINKVFGEARNTVYKVTIVDYKVISVCSARYEDDDLIGAYPVMQDRRNHDETVKGFDARAISGNYSDDHS